MPRPTADAGPERVPDWMLGGTARRRVLERLAEDGPGWSGEDLAKNLGLGRAWTFEIMRILRAINAVEQLSSGRYRLASSEPLAQSLRNLLAALRPFVDTPVDRPPSRKR